jgi:chromosome segregation ATPase
MSNDTKTEAAVTNLASVNDRIKELEKELQVSLENFEKDNNIGVDREKPHTATTNQIITTQNQLKATLNKLVAEEQAHAATLNKLTDMSIKVGRVITEFDRMNIELGKANTELSRVKVELNRVNTQFDIERARWMEYARRRAEFFDKTEAAVKASAEQRKALDALNEYAAAQMDRYDARNMVMDTKNEPVAGAGAIPCSSSGGMRTTTNN